MTLNIYLNIDGTCAHYLANSTIRSLAKQNLHENLKDQHHRVVYISNKEQFFALLSTVHSAGPKVTSAQN